VVNPAPPPIAIDFPVATSDSKLPSWPFCQSQGQISEGEKSALIKGRDQRISRQTLEEYNEAEPEDTQGARLGEIISLLGIATASVGALLFCTISETLKQAIKTRQRSA
jgi:hypothetical protein